MKKQKRIVGLLDGWIVGLKPVRHGRFAINPIIHSSINPF
jgi:hypothetical protein